MNRTIDYQSLKNQNFQLKNQITDLKNAFDLNRDVLKILQQQVQQLHPNHQIFYQIISRLTSINNQIMLTNIEILQQKNKILAENKKMQNTIDNLSNRLDQLLQSKDCQNPKEIHMQMREENRQLREQILALNQDCLRNKLQFKRLEDIIKEKQKQELKKPIIASVKDFQRKIKTQSSQLQKIPKKFQTQGKAKKKTIQKDLQRQNSHLKRLVQELQYRLTLMCRIYETEPDQNSISRQIQYDTQQLKARKLNQRQLGLLMFAMKNTHLQEDIDNDNIKVTITKRINNFMPQQRKLTHSLSSIL